MESVFLYTSVPPNDTLTRYFRNYVNLAYTVAVGEPFPTTALDQTANIIRGCRASLRDACERAKREVDREPMNQPLKFNHVLLIESELVDVFAVAPASCKLVSLSVRTSLCEFAGHLRKFYGIQTPSESQN